MEAVVLIEALAISACCVGNILLTRRTAKVEAAILYLQNILDGQTS